jgi:hypothetical protein
MTAYTLQIFKIESGMKTLFKEIVYQNASGHHMMDVIYGARHFGIANYFNLPQDNVYDVGFI